MLLVQSMLFQMFKVGFELFNQANEAKLSPFGLEGELLLFFRDLKKSIDSKNIKRIQNLISDKYRSQTFNRSNKREIVAYFQSIFDELPPFTHPSLEIEICKTPEVNEHMVYLVIRATFNVQFLGITLSSGPFGARERIAILLEKDANLGLFSIIRMEVIDQE